LDIKTTASFGKMAQEACLQVLGYYALRKSSNPDMRYVGFVLPLQREISIYDVSTWDSGPYLALLAAEAHTRTRPTGVADVLANFFQQVTVVQAQDCMAACGHHIRKGKAIVDSLTAFAARLPGRPCQLFITNARSGKRSAATAGQVAAAAPVVRARNLTVFIHAPYVINLCAGAAEIRDGKLVLWQQDILNGDLQLGAIMGCKGVVVHTGAQKLRTLEEARNTMFHMVRTALQYATEECKLLLETPCGEGTEICTTLSTLGDFCHLFNEEEQKKLGLCVDTCHVFAAGYDPLEYMKHWTQHVKTPICLVHFNDSKDSLGSHRDRHAPPGTGHIGVAKMLAIADWCVAHNIPMVVE
jgi:deoxyribonuclease-4